MEKKAKKHNPGAGPPLGNRNAEVWDLEASTKLFNDSLELSKSPEYDFMGEIARELGTYLDIYDHIISRFPHLDEVKKHIKRNCEANCYSNSKKGKIREATAIVNLKSNHQWTDRTQTENTNKNLDIELTREERDKELAELLKKAKKG